MMSVSFAADTDFVTLCNFKNPISPVWHHLLAIADVHPSSVAFTLPKYKTVGT